MTLSRPRTTRRLLRGSVLGLGLLVAAGVSAPAAFAVEETGDGTDVPVDGEQSPPALRESPAPANPSAGTTTLAPALSGNFGTGKDFTLQVTSPGPVPGDLDLSGAVFRATPALSPVAGDPQTLARDGESYTCTTDVLGTCTFDGPQRPFNLADYLGLLGAGQEGDGDGPVDLVGGGSVVGLPAGYYTLTQVSSSPGLAPATGSKGFAICGTGGPSCGPVEVLRGQVADDSLFRTSLVTTVTDVDTEEPVACAGYQLTGPDYPHNPATATQQPVTGTVPAECLEPTTAPTTSPSTATTTAPTTTAATATTTPTTTTTDDGSGATSSTGTTTTTTSTVAPGPVVLDLAAAETPLVTFGTQVSDRTGTMTFPGWFLPADGYLLTPTTTPAGYAPDVTDAFSITTTAQQAAAGEPAAVARALAAGLAPGAQGPDPTTGSAGVAAAGTTTAPGAATTTAAAADQAALATTGTPVGSMMLLGTGLVALGGGALATGSVLRRRARQRA
ncbi:hypothetical protein SAMN05660199_04634 [Klenkia soli]|uniref:LPXTG-motif cell wall anchor domain-containing protein n=1 Tax=Klenkia soli TaxID=1052260 RepID=A0A1H0UTM2_9ACTN|nr:hypothetical protein [Klenkia soli]SDP69567.1 hypothetical protein SAMN05660199_04634 [Klenkia soli]